MALLSAEHPARQQTEQMVREVYRATYGARIDAFPPLMIAALDASGRALCAAGLRTASTGFFSECYLDASAEASISKAAGLPVARDDVLEVTTLAGEERGLALKLVEFVIEQQALRGMRWGMFTATAPLLRALASAGLQPLELARAVPERVTNPARWGNYYRMRPRVCAIADPLREPSREPLRERVSKRFLPAMSANCIAPVAAVA